MLRKILLGVIGVVAIGAIAYFGFGKETSTAKQGDLFTEVAKGAFEVRVTATGELQAKKSEKILGPQGMRSAGIFQTTISDIVAEGTIVEEGSYVATLDRTEIGNKLKTVATDIERTETQLLQAKLDTAIELRSLRDNLINLSYQIEEKKLEVEQNIYEPPAIQRQTQIELERIERDAKQSKDAYQLKIEQAEAKISEILTTLRQHQTEYNRLSELSDGFIVKAPKAGMVIYERSWNGKKGPGSRINAWDPIVARLPDLTDMISQTYVNEVDISKVKTNQQVDIQIDAFPDMKYTGRVLSVANIGEQRPNFDSKVFEVKIQLLQSDSILRPAMTTSNELVTNVYEDVLYLPLEAVHSNDSMSFAFVKEGNKILKKELILGPPNDQDVIIEHGLAESETVFLNFPAGGEEMVYTLLPEEVKQAYLLKKQEEEAKRQAAAKAREEEMKKRMEQFKGGRPGGGRPSFKFNK
ncbi:MAG: HlyD family efflux transporter periplasmic adaptor subunit [Bacteroidota bacterium]